MKKTIIATLVLVISAFATATAGTIGETASSSSKKITMYNSFSKLVVEGNVDVVLYEDETSTDIRTFGLNSDMAATTITQENGVLTIKNKKGKGEKVLVYVPVKDLIVIEASGNSKVSSATPLNSELITLVAKGECKFNILSTGVIEVVEEGNVEVHVEKRSISTKTVSRS
jgi:Putative auto-transporter adhesin, head GIN domain